MIQNEILHVMAMQVLRNLTANLQSTKFTVMVDETTDVSTTEQVVIVFRWVDSSLEVHEDFVGLYESQSQLILLLVSSRMCCCGSILS